MDIYNCATLNSGVNCYMGTDGRCFDSGSTCTPVTSCAQVVKGSGTALTDALCTDHRSECVAKTDGSACIISKATCPEYLSALDCARTSGASSVKCYYTTSCIAITDTTCGTVVKGSNNLTDEMCSAYNSACVAKTDGSACLKQMPLCTDYTDPLDCVKTSGASSVKCFYGASCVAITDSTCGTVV